MNCCSKQSDSMDDGQSGTSSVKDLNTNTNSETPVPDKQQDSKSSMSSGSFVEYKDDEKKHHSNPFLNPDETKVFQSQEHVFPSDVTGNTPRISLQESPTLSTQTVTGIYDPNRIPASVFSSKPTTPMEWSVASNDSLFSIHVGNTSFSRDNVFMLYKSGELPKFDEPYSSHHPVNESEKVETKTNGSEKGSEMNEEKTTGTGTGTVIQGLASKTSKEVSVETPKSTNQMHQADDLRHSIGSAQSFQFPLLDHDTGRDASVKMGTQKQILEKSPHEDMQPQNNGATPKSSWFSCFSCCSLGC